MHVPRLHHHAIRAFLTEILLAAQTEPDAALALTGANATHGVQNSATFVPVSGVDLLGEIK